MKNINLLFLFFVLLFWSCSGNKQPKTKNSQPSVRSDSIIIDSLTGEIRANPREDAIYAQRANYYLKQGEIQKAINDLTIANKLDSLNPQYYTDLSDYYLQLGKSELTNKLLLKANRLIPDNKEILYRLGNLYFYVQDYKKAFNYINEALEVDPFYAKAFFTKALVYRELGQDDRAIRELQIAVEREPDYYDAYVLLGNLYSQENDSIAVDYYENALRIMPYSYEANYGKAIFYQENQQPLKALEVYQHMIDSLQQKKNITYYNMGYVNMEYLKKYQQAIAYYDSALIFTPDFVEAYLNKGFCYEQLKNYPESRKMYIKVLEMHPNMDLAIKGLNRLDKKQTTQHK